MGGAYSDIGDANFLNSDLAGSFVRRRQALYQGLRQRGAPSLGADSTTVDAWLNNAGAQDIALWQKLNEMSKGAKAGQDLGSLADEANATRAKVTADAAKSTGTALAPPDMTNSYMKALSQLAVDNQLRRSSGTQSAFRPATVPRPASTPKTSGSGTSRRKDMAGGLGRTDMAGGFGKK